MRKFLQPDFEQIGRELKNSLLWCAWVPKEEPNRISKIPISIAGRFAKTNDPNTFAEFSAAKAFYDVNSGNTLRGLPGPITGVGVLISGVGNIVGIDIDHVFDSPGQCAEWAKDFVEQLKEITYCELSPSGTGLHAFLRCQKTISECKDSGLEIYKDKRFFTVTGHRLPGCQDTIASGQQAQIMMGKLEEYVKQKSTRKKGRAAPTQEPQPPKISPSVGVDNDTMFLNDDWLLDKARHSKNKFSFTRLFDDGDISRHNSASEADQALCNYLAFWTGKDAERMDRLMRQSALLREPERLAKWDKVHSQGATYGEMTIAKAIEGTKDIYEPHGKKRKATTVNPTKYAPSAKPKILYAPGQLPRELKELDASLFGHAWQRNELVVRVVRLPEPRSFYGLRQPAGLSVISYFDKNSLAVLSSKCADWVTLKKNRATGEYEEVACDPPETIITKYLAAPECWHIQSLAGLITCPIIRCDGSILDKPGYDPATYLYADFDPKDFPQVRGRPTKADAQAAMYVLKDALSEFAFREDEENIGVNKSVALAAMLTTVLRPSVDHVPLIAFNAPCPGTGKSTLADLIGIMMTGKPCSAMDYNADAAEFKKAVFASLLEGPPIVLIDNVMSELESSLLNIVLTQESVSGRVLGLSKNAKVPTTSIWLATGNNLVIAGELTRRTLICTLDAEVEKPASRSFSRDIYQWAGENRGKLIHAALTILRAFYVAGKPLDPEMEPMNGFNQWSKWVRGALAWMGESDPKKSQVEIEAHDPVKEALSTIMAAWWEHFGSKAVTTKDMLDRNPPNGMMDIPDTQINFYQALVEHVQYKRELTPKYLGQWLTKYERRIVDGMRFRRCGTFYKAILWKMEKV